MSAFREIGLLNQHPMKKGNRTWADLMNELNGAEILSNPMAVIGKRLGLDMRQESQREKLLNVISAMNR